MSDAVAILGFGVVLFPLVKNEIIAYQQKKETKNSIMPYKIASIITKPLLIE